LEFNINVNVGGKIDVFHHSDDETKAQLESISTVLVELTKKIVTIITKENQQMATAQELLAKVEEQTTIIGGINVLIADLKEDIANIPGIPPEVQAAIDASFAKVTSNSDALAANLVVNVPPEPPPV
jgi:tripartite-type tricarboxylate transporter receptor subunit TctC